MIPGRQDTRFLGIAASLKPDLKTKVELPIAIVTVVKDEASTLGWTVGRTASPETSEPLEAGEHVIFDFEGHRAGFFEFQVEAVQTGIEPADAPCRLHITYGEVLNDVAESFENYKWVPYYLLH
jgi:alpha-L-rhamnosidase